ncbi:MAG: hypothetical protein KDA44_08765 [Planctomycetales bacterium]|nr:hypothetical protein [Planctomycetales bacterium]
MNDESANHPPLTAISRLFHYAGIYGLIVLLPQYFLEGRLGREFPPPTNHPEHFYGFVGVAAAWQVAFLIIARDPVRYRPMMLAGSLEKFGFGIPAVVLFLQGRLAGGVLPFALVDLVMGTAFVAAWRATDGRAGRPQRSADADGPS